MRKSFAAFAALAISVLMVTIGQPGSVGAASPAICGNTSTGNTALTDLGSRTFNGEQGGLYPGGSNAPPDSYRAAGIDAARAVVPLDRLGRPNPSGTVVFLSIGMSNASQEFSFFASSEAKNAQSASSVTMVNGAQGGQVAVKWTSSSDPTWGVVDQRLATAGVTAQQVEVVWLKQADFVPQHPDFETYAHTLQTELGQITSIASQRYPHLRQVFVSARTYGGYSGIFPTTGTVGPNPEPWAYETGFADKWFVAQSVANPAQRPWVGWGPYFWTDGTRGRADGLQWFCSDTADGTHPSTSGDIKVSAYMQSMFSNSVFTPWFAGSTPVQNPGPSPIPVRSPVPTPVATPIVPPGAAHPATPRPGATQPAQSPVANIPQSSGSAGSISQAIALVSALPATLGWSPVAIAIVLIGALVTAFALLVMGRRWRLSSRLLKKPINDAGANGSGPPTDMNPAASEQPVLMGVGAGERGSQEGGQPPTQ